MSRSRSGCTLPRAFQFLRGLTFFAGTVTALVAAASAGSDTEVTGTITGSVINATTQKVLERAVVAVEGSPHRVLTDSDGGFRLAGVRAGERKVQVSYAGLADGSVTVVVPPHGVVTATVELRAEEVIELEAVTVLAELEGNAYAVQQQKNAESQRNVVSADAFGVISDANPGEFLKLMPGIQMDYTGIEPRGIRVRAWRPI